MANARGVSLWRLAEAAKTGSEGCAWAPRRAGELSAAELESLMVIVANPRTFKIPDWFLNRQKDHKDGRYGQITSSALDTKLRDDLERLKKIRCAPPRSAPPPASHLLSLLSASLGGSASCLAVDRKER